MGRRRKSNKNLPTRVYPHHGSYRYVPKSGPPVTLAKMGDYAGMLRALAALLGDDDPQFGTLGAVMDHYLIEVTPGKGKDSRRKEPGQMAKLRAVFGHFRPGDLAQADAYQYLLKRGRRFSTAAIREIELLSHVCTVAPKWGRDWPPNPLRGMEKGKSPPRKRYVTNDEYLAAWELAPPMIRCAMDMAMLTGLRRGDILGLTRKNMTDDGLRVMPGKTEKSSGVELLFEWTPALRSVLKQALARPPQVRQAIICSNTGHGI